MKLSNTYFMSMEKITGGLFREKTKRDPSTIKKKINRKKLPESTIFRIILYI